MAVVHIPASLRHLTGDRDRIGVPGATLRQVVAALDRECPALTAVIIDDDDLRADIAIAIDGSILEGAGLVEPVGPDAEIYLVPPIGGGSGGQPPCSPRSPQE
ncbi:MAG: MoaD/ThiS family protein [Chloroflexota bacterium]